MVVGAPIQQLAFPSRNNLQIVTDTVSTSKKTPTREAGRLKLLPQNDQLRLVYPVFA